MKFITSRIISPGQVKSLMEIIAEKEEELAESKIVVASSSGKTTKTASVEEVAAREVEKIAKKEEEKIEKEEETDEEDVIEKEDETDEDEKLEKEDETDADEKLEKEDETDEEVKEKTKKAGTSKEFNLKEVKAAKAKYAGTFGVIWKKLRSTAALSPQDRSFLIEYYKKYYPADYAEALIAQY